MLEIRNVSKTFNAGTINEKKALRDLSLTLSDGDFVTVIGGNGAGKSTLLNAICGTWRVDCGEIVIDGKDVTMQIKVGDRILYSKYAGSDFKIDGKNLTILRQNDVLAVVED